MPRDLTTRARVADRKRCRPMAHRSLLSRNEPFHTSFQLRSGACQQAEADSGRMEYYRAMACRRVGVRQFLWSVIAIRLWRVAPSALRGGAALLWEGVWGLNYRLKGACSGK